MIKLIHGNCLEKMNDIPNKSIDMILADIPYGKNDCEGDYIIPFNQMWEHLKRIIKFNGAILLTGNQPFTTYLIASNIKMFKYHWVWNKGMGSSFALAKYKPMIITEDILVFGNKGKINYYPIMEDREKNSYVNKGSSNSDIVFKGTIAKSSKDYNPKKRYPKNILNYSKYINECNPMNNRFHPTQKPIILMEYLIKTYTKENETVLDFCMGSGTTGIACKNLNRSFIGIELNKEYFEIAKKRINEISN